MKFVIVHKRIRSHEKESGRVVLSDKEVQQCQALNHIKDAIDLLIMNREQLINNEADFNQRVIGAVAIALREMKIDAQHDDRLFISDLIAGEYLREYNVLR